MFKLNRNYGPPLVALIGISLFLVLAGLHNHKHEGEPYYGAPKQEYRKPPVLSAVPTPSSNPKPNRKEWREETDLNAQRDMAQWAFWMFIVSGTGVVVGVLGLALIRETLVATRATNDSFRESSSKELRAYVGVEPVPEKTIVEIDLSEDQPLDVDVIFVIKITNYGQTPAQNLRYTGNITFGPHGPDFEARLPSNIHWKPCAPLNPGQSIEGVIGQKMSFFDRWLYGDSPHTMILTGAIQFSSLGENHTVTFCFHINSMKEWYLKYRNDPETPIVISLANDGNEAN